jgi:WD40 repeat protein/serine/threonine protein kinase
MQDEGRRNDQSHDDRLADVIERFLADSESGSAPSRVALLEQHPDLADDLAACLETLDFIGHSLGQGPATAVLQCGQQFGEYQILRELGRGGMGVVYEAYHLGLERRVALKVLSGRSFEDAAQRERFLQEAKTAAGLHHTNIVPIFEVGELDGVCYYSMQFIAGESLGSVVRRLSGRALASPRQDITIFPPGTIVRDDGSVSADAAQLVAESTPPRRVVTALDDGPVTERYFREVCRLVTQAADALSHAHTHGIVHRDVKPSNFILDPEGRLWVTDFGLAFRSDDPHQRGARDAVGTPAYMSPEQVRPGSAPVDYRTDIYSLGATLYELITLRPIFEGDTSLAVLTQIAAVDPVPPRQHSSQVPVDLDCIVRRATAKRPEDRYGEMGAMGADLQRYLDFEPVHARRTGPLRRMMLWCRRDPRLAAVTGAAATVLLALSVMSHWAILRARNVAVRARQQAETQLALTTVAEAKATENYRESLSQQARATLLSFENGRRWAALDLIRQAQATGHNNALRDDAITALSIPDARLVARRAVDNIVERLVFSSARHQIAFGCRDGSVRLWDFEPNGTSDGEITTLVGSGIDTESVAFSSSARFLSAVEGDGTIVVWDTNSKKEFVRLDTEEFRPRFLAFVDDQAMLIALNAEGTCRRWEISGSGVEPVESIELASRWQAATTGPESDCITLATSNGETLVWNVVSGERRVLEGISLNRGRSPLTLLWDSQGKQFAAGHRSETVDIWSDGHSPPHAYGGHHGTVRAIAFHPFGELLATSGNRDPAVKLWDTATGDLIALLREPANAHAAAFSSDGQFLAAGGADRTIWVWEVVRPRSFRRWAAHEDVVTQVAISPDGSLIASGSADGSVALWPPEVSEKPVFLSERAHERETRFRPQECAGLMFSPDGRLLAERLHDNAIRVWDVATHDLVASLNSRPNMRTSAALFAPSGREIIRLSNDAIERWSIGDKLPETIAKSTGRLTAMAMFPGGDRVAVCSASGSIQVLDLSNGAAIGQPLELPTQGVAMAIDRTGSYLAVGDRSGVVHLVDLRTMTMKKSWKESDDELTSVTFSPDASWLGVTAQDGIVRLRNMPDGELVATLTKHEGGARSLAFGPRSVRLVTCGDDKCVHVWRLDTLNSELSELGLAW